jgi:uncharacterized membrane protein
MAICKVVKAFVKQNNKKHKQIYKRIPIVQIIFKLTKKLYTNYINELHAQNSHSWPFAKYHLKGLFV